MAESKSETTDAELKTVVGPPGPLGLFFVDSKDGPVVATVKKTSPLAGKVFPGEILRSVNGATTHSMKAQDTYPLFLPTE